MKVVLALAMGAAALAPNQPQVAGKVAAKAAGAAALGAAMTLSSVPAFAAAGDSIRRTEPVARKGPKNVTSSGVSFRDDALPLPSLEELVKIVAHYENKASGQYVVPADTPVPTIGRDLFEMCSEMRKMAIGLQGVREAQDERIRCASRLAPPPPPRAPD